MVAVTSAPRYIPSASCNHPRYQSRSSMYIRGLIPRNFAELCKAVPIVGLLVTHSHSVGFLMIWLDYITAHKSVVPF